MRILTRAAEQPGTASAEPERRFAPIVTQALKFGAVGGIGLVVNFAVFNGLSLTVLDRTLVDHGPLWATAIATIVAIVANWIGNRFWAFAGQRRASTWLEGVEFFAVSIVGMLIPLACVWVSNYALGLHSLVADNVANYVVGLALGTLFRFSLYRWWVFSPRRDERRRLSALERALPVAEGPLVGER